MVLCQKTNAFPHRPILVGLVGASWHRPRPGPAAGGGALARAMRPPVRLPGGPGARRQLCLLLGVCRKCD